MNIEHENTIRALRDEQPLITNRWCHWGFHRWEQWSHAYIPKGGYKNLQHAYCACCNKMRVRTVNGV